MSFDQANCITTGDSLLKKIVAKNNKLDEIFIF